MRGGILELEGISGFSMTKNPNCDVCEMQMASMYCEADEAYLCEECDASVHGANTLASRHKRVHIIEGEQQIEYETEDGVCPAHPFPTFSTESTALKALDFPLGGIRIGDITYARVSHENSSMGRNILDMEMNIPNSNEEEEAHQVPRFVPVAQELPSVEPFRFHALAGSGGTPAKSMRFISLLEGEPDPDDQAEPDNVTVQEHQELGVVPELSTSSKVAGTTTPVTPKGPKADKEREARVNRYREKRRTRMFSKKIRYEVRKIYAENRPRLKGRFVRRTNEMDSLQFMT